MTPGATPPTNGAKAARDQIKLIIATVAVSSTVTGGFITLVSRFLDAPTASITVVESKLDRANETLTQIRVNQAVISQKIDAHVEDTKRHTQ